LLPAFTKAILFAGIFWENSPTANTF
jgi:hypothetical protein